MNFLVSFEFYDGKLLSIPCFGFFVSSSHIGLQKNEQDKESFSLFSTKDVKFLDVIKLDDLIYLS